MRNLHKVLFLSLLGVTLAAGCTLTTTDGNGAGGEGGADTSTGGAKASGGTTATTGGTTSVAGATSTAAFTAANCTAAAAIVPASVPDVTSACISCIYTTACTQAVTCHNDGTCMTATLKALECIELNFQLNTVADADAVQACQDGTLAASDIPSAADITAASMTVKSSDAGAWLGAVVPLNGTAVVDPCSMACHLSDT